MGGSLIPYVQDADFTLYVGDALEVLQGLPDESARACVTSPPYLDARPEYPSPTLRDFELIFGELRRVLTDCALFNVGRLWRNGIEQLWWIDLIRAAERVGWHLLDTLVWVKPNANPIHGQVFANSHEYVLILGRSGDRLNEDAVRTEYDPESLARYKRRWRNSNGVKGGIREQEGREANELGARARSFFVAHVGREKGNPHPAPMPLELAEHLVQLASWEGDTILDPFAGSGTTCLAARRLGRHTIGIELSPAYAEMAARRTRQLSLLA